MKGWVGAAMIQNVQTDEQCPGSAEGCQGKSHWSKSLWVIAWKAEEECSHLGTHSHPPWLCWPRLLRRIVHQGSKASEAGLPNSLLLRHWRWRSLERRKWVRSSEDPSDIAYRMTPSVPQCTCTGEWGLNTAEWFCYSSGDPTFT